jgi:sigma-B regulation protein RsbQ
MASDRDARARVDPQEFSALRLDGPLARRHRARLIGDGCDLLVFSHGLGTDQTAWTPVVQRLPPQFSALLFDLPGAGPLLHYAFDPDRYRSIARFADDLLDLLDEVGVTRCRYVGHSVSGMIGVLAAIEDPGRFSQLLLLNASPRYLNEAGYQGGFDREDLEGLLGAMASNYQAWVAGFAPAAIAADVPAAVEDFSRGLLAMRPDITVRIARAIFESDVRDLLCQLRVPTVLIHSRADIAVPPSVAHYLRDHIAGATLAWIAASGHLPHMSAPAEVADVISRHLTGDDIG